MVGVKAFQTSGVMRSELATFHALRAGRSNQLFDIGAAALGLNLFFTANCFGAGGELLPVNQLPAASGFGCQGMTLLVAQKTIFQILGLADVAGSVGGLEDVNKIRHSE